MNLLSGDRRLKLDRLVLNQATIMNQYERPLQGIQP